MEIVDRGKGHEGEFACFIEMVEIAFGIVLTGVAGAGVVGRSKGEGVIPFVHPDVPFIGKEHAMARGPCRIGAVKGVDPERDAPR